LSTQRRLIEKEGTARIFQ